MINPYERRNILRVLYLCITDFICNLFVRHREDSPPKKIDRILVVNPFHQGDVVLTTSIIRILKSEFPEVAIGVMVGSWSARMLSGHNGVERIHVIDHYQISRAPIGLFAKVIKYYRDRKRVLKELGKSCYDLAFIVNGHEPSFIPFCKRAGIRYLVGSTGAGFGPLLNYRISKRRVGQHESQFQRSLLECIIQKEKLNASALVPWLPDPTEKSLARVGEQVKMQGGRDYVILQPGTGNPAKEWPISHWVNFASMLIDDGERIVLCGTGERENELCREIESSCPSVNLASKLTWDDYTALVHGAKGLVGLDSVAVHVASAYSVPALAIMSGVGDRTRWHPIGPLSSYVGIDMPCSPCHSRPCASRDCISKVSPEHVYAAWKNLPKRCTLKC
ncbi:glycosyltransferase family 9 protein [Niveibacterium terrae]|uniref:glycosyltransferase family 9 protein n=1 Tax=Niveibacterium terrae TaxID=3373598 RepID=UPI003A932EE2